MLKQLLMNGLNQDLIIDLFNTIIISAAEYRSILRALRVAKIKKLDFFCM